MKGWQSVYAQREGLLRLLLTCSCLVHKVFEVGPFYLFVNLIVTIMQWLLKSKHLCVVQLRGRAVDPLVKCVLLDKPGRLVVGNVEVSLARGFQGLKHQQHQPMCFFQSSSVVNREERVCVCVRARASSFARKARCVKSFVLSFY